MKNTTREGRLGGRVALVTGAGSGIGRAIAHALATEDATVVVSDLVPEATGHVADEIETAGGVAVAATLDVSDAAQVAQVVDDVVARQGRIDILVNNAGVCGVRPLLELTEEEFTRMWRVHALGTFLVSRRVAPHMVERRYGRIVSVSSGEGGFGASSITAHYQAAKSAQSSFTRSLALALGPYGITANCISPALVVTPLWEGLDADYRHASGHGVEDEIALRLADHTSIPLGRATSPEEVAALVVHLSLPQTATITGQIIAV